MNSGKSKRLPLSLDEEMHIFWRQHSLSISTFARLERLIVELVSVGMSPESVAAVDTALYGIESFRGKLEFADRYVRIRMADSPAALERWIKIHEASIQANRSRNQIVHWTTYSFSDAKPGRRFVLVRPPSHPTAANERFNPDAVNPPADAIGVHRLIEIHLEIRNAFIMMQQIGDYSKALEDGLEKPYKLQKLVDQFRSDVKTMSAALEPRLG